MKSLTKIFYCELYTWQGVKFSLYLDLPKQFQIRMESNIWPRISEDHRSCVMNTNVATISFLKKNAAALDLSEPLTITQNGIPAYVIESYEDRMRRDEAIALVKLLSFASKDKSNGNLISGDDLRSGWEKRRSQTGAITNEEFTN